MHKLRYITTYHVGEAGSIHNANNIPQTTQDTLPIRPIYTYFRSLNIKYHRFLVSEMDFPYIFPFKCMLLHTFPSLFVLDSH